MQEVVYRNQNFSNTELEQKTFKIVIFSIAYSNIFLLSNMQCKQEVKIDENTTVGNNTLVINKNILTVFVQKQSSIKAVQIPPYNLISTDPKEQNWAIIGMGKKYMLFDSPLMQFFCHSRI